LEEFNNHLISLDLQSPLDHASISVSFIVEEEFIQEKKQSIVRNSDKEKEFVNKLRYQMDSIEITNIANYKELEYAIQEFAFTIEDL